MLDFCQNRPIAIVEFFVSKCTGTWYSSATVPGPNPPRSLEARENSAGVHPNLIVH